MKFALILLLYGGAMPGVVPVATPVSAPTQASRAYTTAHEQEIIADFVKFLAIPNLASDRENIARNADAIVAMFASRSISATGAKR